MWRARRIPVAKADKSANPFLESSIASAKRESLVAARNSRRRDPSSSPNARSCSRLYVARLHRGSENYSCVKTRAFLPSQVRSCMCNHRETWAIFVYYGVYNFISLCIEREFLVLSSNKVKNLTAVKVLTAIQFFS